MSCILPNANIKIFAKAIHSLAKIGDELFVEFKSEELEVCTTNQTQSAFSTFTFKKFFFQSFVNDKYESVKCKISVRCALAVFKASYIMEKTVDSCHVYVNDDCSELIFKLIYIKGFTKTHFIPVLENDHVKLDYSKEDMPNSFTIYSKFLHNAIKHFRTQDEEITFVVTPQKVFLRNYYGGAEGKKSLRTELYLNVEDFESYCVSVFGAITFSLKELRAIILFSELANSAIEIRFGDPGSPIIFTVMNDLSYESDYVIGTLPAELITDQGSMNAADIDSVPTQINNLHTQSSVTIESSTSGIPPLATSVTNVTVPHHSPSVAKTVNTQPKRASLNVYNLSNVSDNELLSHCPELNDVSDYMSEDDYRDKTQDIVRMQKLKNVFQNYLQEVQNNSLLDTIGNEDLLVYDSDGLTEFT